MTHPTGFKISACIQPTGIFNGKQVLTSTAPEISSLLVTLQSNIVNILSRRRVYESSWTLSYDLAFLDITLTSTQVPMEQRSHR